MLVRKKGLEIFLSLLKPNLAPKVFWEQYSTPPYLAALLLTTAAHTFNDVRGKLVCDLGCGTGILALGACYLGAAEAVGVDIDPQAVKTAKENSDHAGLRGRVHWAVGDIEVLCGQFDTVVQNPPFGVKRRGADLKFLIKALDIAKVVYSIHKSGEGGRRFIRRLVEGKGGRITAVVEAKLAIPRTFHFHRKPRREVKVDIYRIER